MSEKKRYRSAQTGRFVDVDYAHENPDITVGEGRKSFEGILRSEVHEGSADEPFLYLVRTNENQSSFLRAAHTKEQLKELLLEEIDRVLR